MNYLYLECQNIGDSYCMCGEKYCDENWLVCDTKRQPPSKIVINSALKMFFFEELTKKEYFLDFSSIFC